MRFEVDDGHKVLDQLVQTHRNLVLSDANEAETRFKVIDWVIRKVLGWADDDISVEERISKDKKSQYLDYLLSTTAALIVVEAKRATAFTLPNKHKKGRLGGWLKEGEVGQAIKQAREYCSTRSAQFGVVTNGSAWVVFPAIRTDGIPVDDTEAIIFRSLEDVQERFVDFWDLLSRQRVIESSLQINFFPKINQSDSRRPITLLHNPGYRIGRNSLYQYLESAINKAFTDEGLLNDPEALEYCYVKTAERVKFDSRLDMHIKDARPILDHATTRVRSKKSEGYLDSELTINDRPPRFFLILGPVGAGKSTFLRYTRLVSAKENIESGIVWIVVDFKRATKEDNPRKFIYREVLNFIENDKIFLLNDWMESVQPAYNDNITSLSAGHMSLLRDSDEAAYKKEIYNYIDGEFKQVEPFVERILKHSSGLREGYLIIDNVDQIEDESLQAEIFSEAQALAQKIGFSVIMSMRESTYLKSRHSAKFDAFQFDSIYVDPPNVLPVISRRLAFAKNLLNNKHADIPIATGTHFKVMDLGVFIDIVSASILADQAAFMFEVLSANNIRRGLTLVREFLASGHITADEAIRVYLTDRKFVFSQHDVFRGAVLGGRKFYKEEESLLPNLYCSKLNRKDLQLLSLRLIYFFASAASTSTYEGTSMDTLCESLGAAGITIDDVEIVLEKLINKDVIKVADGRIYTRQAKLYPTRLAGYLLHVLSTQFNFCEMCVMDAEIYDDEIWDDIVTVTKEIEEESDIVERIKHRIRRIKIFFSYIKSIEERWVIEARRRSLASVWDQQILLYTIIPQAEVNFEKVIRAAEKQKIRQKGFTR